LAKSIEEQKRELKLQKLEMLRWNKQYEQDNRIKFFNTPKLPANPLQAELIEAWDDPEYTIFTYTGANRIGKTTILAVAAFSTMFGKWPWSNKKLPMPGHPPGEPRKVRIVGQDWEKHVKTVLIPTLKYWWPKERDVHIKKNSLGVDAVWTDVITGSTLEIMSNKQESDLHEGWWGDLIGYDEPPKREVRVANARGLIDWDGRELFTMTLLKEAWVDRDIIKRLDEDGLPDRTIYNVYGDIYSNVGYGITEKGVERFSKELSADERDARIRGIPSYMAGLVCPKFSRKKHIRERFEIPLDWIVDIAIDVHPRNEQAILFIATSPRGDRYACQEIYRHGSGTEVGEWVIRAINHFNYRVGKIIIDPLAKGDKNVGETTFDKIDMVLSRFKYTLYTASKDKDSGIIEINNHLEGPNKEPSLFFFRDLKRTIMEIEGWMYDEETQVPQKKDDHMMENLYRICLENTAWYPMEEDDYEEEEQSTANAWTGY
jgi:hypothetical protein